MKQKQRTGQRKWVRERENKREIMNERERERLGLWLGNLVLIVPGSMWRACVSLQGKIVARVNARRIRGREIEWERERKRERERERRERKWRREKRIYRGSYTPRIAATFHGATDQSMELLHASLSLLLSRFSSYIVYTIWSPRRDAHVRTRNICITCIRTFLIRYNTSRTTT